MTDEEIMFRFERDVNQALWDMIMQNDKNDVYGYDIPYKNDTFEVKLFDWNNEDNNDWHFWHKPSGLKVCWYKYPLRAASVNMYITHEQFLAVLRDCMNSVRADKHINVAYCVCRWWENCNDLKESGDEC